MHLGNERDIAGEREKQSMKRIMICGEKGTEKGTPNCEGAVFASGTACYVSWQAGPLNAYNQKYRGRRPPKGVFSGGPADNGSSIRQRISVATASVTIADLRWFLLFHRRYCDVIEAGRSARSSARTRLNEEYSDAVKPRRRWWEKKALLPGLDGKYGTS